MRCIALGQAWTGEGGSAVLLMGPERSPAGEALASERMEVRHLDTRPGSREDAMETARQAGGLGARWVVLDGYHFDTEYQGILKGAGLSLLVLDDLGRTGPLPADIVVNPNLYAGEGLYPGRGPATRLLLGSRYALLRQEFLDRAGRAPVIRQHAGRLLLSLGGADPGNLTRRLMERLGGPPFGGVELVVVVGGNNPSAGSLESLAATSDRISLVKDPPRFSDLLAGADAAIVGGGVTCSELAFLGIPFLVVSISENQRPVAEGFEAAGAAVNLGGGEEAVSMEGTAKILEVLGSADLRGRLSAAGQALVDGDGAARVVLHLRGDPLRLRRVREGDLRQLWEWANDPAVRESAFTGGQISLEEHRDWFRKKRADPNCLHYIAFDREDRPVGQVRFDLAGPGGEVDVSVDRSSRKRGYGTALIRAGVEKLARERGPHVLLARVKAGNTASLRSFRGAGFAVEGEEVAGGARVVRLAWTGPADRGEGA